MAERSRDRSSSTESQPKFPECSHFRRRNDNHRRCQQCRLNDGLPLCTQDSPCLVCQDWLPEAWTAQAKATAQRNRCKSSEEGKWDDGRFDGITRTKGRFSYQGCQVPRFVQGQAVKNSHKFLATQVRGFQRHGGGTAQLPRVGPPQVEDAWTQAKTRWGKTSRVSEASVVTPWQPQQRPERASVPGQVPLVAAARVDVPSPAVSQRRRTPVRRALPLAIISIILRAIVDPSHHLDHGRLQTASLSPVTARDDERAPTGRVGRLSPDGMSSYLLRSPRPLRNARSRWLPRRPGIYILNWPQQFQSRPR